MSPARRTSLIFRPQLEFPDRPGALAPAYGALGLGFAISFAAQGAGHVFWPFTGVTVRMIIAAGLGWIAVTRFGAGMTGLALVVALSLLVYAAICSAAMKSRTVLRRADS